MKRLLSPTRWKVIRLRQLRRDNSVSALSSPTAYCCNVVAFVLGQLMVNTALLFVNVQLLEDTKVDHTMTVAARLAAARNVHLILSIYRVSIGNQTRHDSGKFSRTTAYNKWSK